MVKFPLTEKILILIEFLIADPEGRLFIEDFYIDNEFLYIPRIKISVLNVSFKSEEFLQRTGTEYSHDGFFSD